ncbi:MAG: beta-Ala-His dipeptidase [Longibaculum muris]|uniref:Cytosol non-specific dipeptidase n=1 Tax=Longibaculum muris TaxID=1796628 RepID=A0A4R3Z9H7_9FIRM|nr:beta-Ala-His dipeptidase [Longibaculum muris]MBS5369548.1 beta-Ala-His dipeptidase [Coprobacillus cateniformis]MCR1887818.1 beta-Ala-His dipeptidase [Longibaculum muris]MED9812140.1 beta-Ala-His dipeptidase [Longibaculum muris]TCW01276.1 dipeptidase D [Longibaculum muris]
MAVLDESILINRYFEEIAQIPHGSYHEEGIADYIEQLAIEHELKYYRDEMNNIVIFKEASKGYEKHEPLMLQAHMDMVNEKNNDSDHDFDHDPLALYVEDGYLHAAMTTLGADDGYGVCYMLAILTDKALKHPPLECVFTVQEEVGLCGALGLDTSILKAKRMIGLDSETEGETCTSSSGGNDLTMVKQIIGEDNDSPVYVLEVKGLLGGHSGECIDKARGNANKLAARIMYHLLKEGIDIRLVEMTGGLKNNAIPRECRVAFASSSSYDLICQLLDAYENDIRQELANSDPDFKLDIYEDECDVCIRFQDSEAIISMMYLAINGLIEKSQVIPGLTTVSLNMGVVRTLDDCIQIEYSIRSPLQSIRQELSLQLELVASLYDGYVEVSNDYPGWDYDPHSVLREQLKAFYHKQTGQALREVATHGGLETGVFKGKIPELDIVTLGPNMADIHTPDERLELKSFYQTYQFLVAFLETL